MGYKLGKYVNVGYNPSFGPSTTDQYSATGGATMVVGENNFVSGTNNVVFGKENLMYGEASSSIIAGTGNQVSGSSFGMTVLGYLKIAQATSVAGTVMGLGSKIGGQGSTAIGYTATGTGDFSAGIGRGNASGYESVAIGASTASQISAVAIGGSATARNALGIARGTGSTSGSIAIGRGVIGAGRFGGFRLNANDGKSTTDSYQICQSLGETTDATPTKIYLSSGGSTDGNFVIDTSAMVHFEVIVQGSDDGSSTVGCVYRLEGVVTRDNNGSNNPAFLGSVTKTVIHEEDAGMDAAITIDNTNKCLDLTVTGKAATTLEWLATWHIHENR
jgi:hypothetical protein